MGRTRIKFCGITSAADAVAAADAGADAVGINFCPASSRCVSHGIAGAIVAALPPWVTPVGLFVDAPAEQVKSVADAGGLTHVQLHGHEPPEFVRKLPAHLRVTKVVHVSPGVRMMLDTWRGVRLAAILLETHSAAAGGSGIENDWTAIAELQEAGAFDGLPPIILAGGLHAQNVGAVVRRLRPYAVDVSSGIEQSKGIKSAEKMRAFVRAVLDADGDR